MIRSDWKDSCNIKFMRIKQFRQTLLKVDNENDVLPEKMKKVYIMAYRKNRNIANRKINLIAVSKPVHGIVQEMQLPHNLISIITGFFSLSRQIHTMLRAEKESNAQFLLQVLDLLR